MGKKLAIAGHSTRGKEVIDLLRMMDGVNWKGHLGNMVNRIYYIHESRLIDYEDINDISPQRIDEYKIFTLEEFLEKYPFKVGDLVDRSIDYVSCIIDDMGWNSEKCCVEYHLNYLNGGECGWHVSDCLIKPVNVDAIIGAKIESTGFMQIGKTVSVIFNSENYEDEVELQLGDYEIEVRDGRTYAVKKKPKYPTTYAECKEILGEDVYYGFTEFMTLQNLIICRNVYWKIAGEQMGLDKPWEPNWDNLSTNHEFIKINKGCFTYSSRLLVFPTEEMRDIFYENFKDLIESCKELL